MAICVSFQFCNPKKHTTRCHHHRWVVFLAAHSSLSWYWISRAEPWAAICAGEEGCMLPKITDDGWCTPKQPKKRKLSCYGWSFYVVFLVHRTFGCPWQLTMQSRWKIISENIGGDPSSPCRIICVYPFPKILLVLTKRRVAGGVGNGGCGRDDYCNS